MSAKLPLIGLLLALSGTSPVAYSALTSSEEKVNSQKEDQVVQDEECLKQIPEEWFCFCKEDS